LYQSGKNVHVNYFNAATASNQGQENTVAIIRNVSEKLPVKWSPMGTYLIVIKADKIVFYGGASDADSKEMKEVICLNQPKTSAVIMSPCERYVLTFSPLADVVYTIWDFQKTKMIREFDYCNGEGDDTYKWSQDGNYIAKQFESEIEKQDGTTRTKQGISVYSVSLTEVSLLEN
jgi:uncharacterized protein with WD repeat